MWRYYIKDILIYTTPTCVKCKMLKKLLRESGINFDEVTDPQAIIDLGFNEAPVIMMNGNAKTYSDTIKWINEQRN